LPRSPALPRIRQPAWHAAQSIPGGRPCLDKTLPNEQHSTDAETSDWRTLGKSFAGLLAARGGATVSLDIGLVVSNAGFGKLQPEGIDVLTLCPGATESESAGLQGIDISSLQHVMPSER